MELIFSYRMTGFFFRLRRTAVIPWTADSRAFESHIFGVDEYNGRALVGAWFNENKDGNIGA